MNAAPAKPVSALLKKWAGETLPAAGLNRPTKPALPPSGAMPRSLELDLEAKEHAKDAPSPFTAFSQLAPVAPPASDAGTGPVGGMTGAKFIMLSVLICIQGSVSFVPLPQPRRNPSSYTVIHELHATSARTDEELGRLIPHQYVAWYKKVLEVTQVRGMPVPQSFLYLCPVKPTGSEIFDPFRLVIVDHNDVDQSNFYTLSPAGVTHYFDGEADFMTAEEFLAEFHMFLKIRHMPVFLTFYLWRAFKGWKTYVVQKKQREAKHALEASAALFYVIHIPSLSIE